MFPSTIASLMATPLAPTGDEVQPWMIAAAACLALLALVLIVVAAKKARKARGDKIGQDLEAARQEALGDKDSAKAGPKHMK